MLRVLAACCLLVVAVPTSAYAEWHFTPMVGLTFRGATSIIDVEDATGKVHKNIGGAVSLLGDGILGVEAIGAWTPGFFEQGDLEFVTKSRTVSLMGNVILTAPRRWTEYSLRPYVSAGLGFLHARVEQFDAVLPPESINTGGYNIGGGAIGFLTARTGVRFDLRYYSTLRRSEEVSVSLEPGAGYLRYMTASVGVVIRR